MFSASVVFLSILCCASANNNHRRSSDDLSQAQLNTILQEVSNVDGESQSNSCVKDFGTPENQIIRTNKSLANGAKFLKAIYGLDSADECREKCCDFKGSTRTSAVCDVAVYQIHKIGSKPQCFLFSCYKESSKTFSCLFSPNLGFAAFKRKPKAVEQELQEAVAENLETKAVDMKTTISVKSTTIPSIQMTWEAVNKDVFGTTQALKCSKACGRFEWKCNDGCCISLRSVCDGEYHCSDLSDEVGCPTVSAVLLENSLHDLTRITAESATDEAEEKTNNELLDTASNVEVVEINANGKIISNITKNNDESKDVEKVIVVEEKGPDIDPDAGAILPLTIGLAVTASVLLLVVCRLRVMKRKLGRRGKAISMDETDYLINGMYL